MNEYKTLNTLLRAIEEFHANVDRLGHCGKLPEDVRYLGASIASVLINVGTYRDVAHDLNVNVSTVYRWLNGRPDRND